MLAQACARQPAPMLARGAPWLRLGVGPTAFGNAIGQGVVDEMRDPSAAENRSALNKANAKTDQDHYGSGTASTQSAGLTVSQQTTLALGRGPLTASAAQKVVEGLPSAGYKWTFADETGYRSEQSTQQFNRSVDTPAEESTWPFIDFGGLDRAVLAGSYGGDYSSFRQGTYDNGTQWFEQTYHRGFLTRMDEGLQSAQEAVDAFVQRTQDEGAAAYARGDRVSAAMAAISYLPDRLVGDTVKGIVSLPRLYTCNDMVPGLMRAASNPMAAARAGYNAFSGMSTQDKIVSAVELLGPAALKFGPGMVNKLNGMPVLGADVGAAARGVGRWAAPAVGDAAFNYLDRMGLVLKAANAGPVRPSNWDALTGHPDAHAFTVHGGAVTDSQLITRALTGVKPDGATGPIPQLSSAFYSDGLLIDTDLAIRNGGGLQNAIARQPGMSVVRVEVQDVGNTGLSLGYGYRRIGATGNGPFNAGAVGPLQRVDNLSSAQGIYEFNSTKGVWETITVYPAPWRPL